MTLPACPPYFPIGSFFASFSIYFLSTSLYQALCKEWEPGLQKDGEDTESRTVAGQCDSDRHRDLTQRGGAPGGQTRACRSVWVTLRQGLEGAWKPARTAAPGQWREPAEWEGERVPEAARCLSPEQSACWQFVMILLPANTQVPVQKNTHSSAYCLSTLLDAGSVKCRRTLPA